MIIYYLVADLGDGSSAVRFFNCHTIRDAYLDEAERTGNYVTDDGSFTVEGPTSIQFTTLQDIEEMFGEWDD